MNDSLVLVEPDDAVRGREAVAVVDEGAAAHDVALTGADNGSLRDNLFSYCTTPCAKNNFSKRSKAQKL